MVSLRQPTAGGQFQVRAVASNILCVSFTPAGRILGESLFVLPQQPDQAIAFGYGGVSTTELRAEFTTTGLRFSATDTDRAFWLEDVARTIAPADEALRVSQTFRVDPSHALYGLGQYPGGVFDWRGKEVLLAQSNQCIAIPFLISTAGFGILWDSMALTRFLSSDDTLHWKTDCAEGIRYYVILGPEFDRIVAGFRLLTGHAPMFPRWALGYWQSKERYVDRDELLTTAWRFRELGFPIDGLIQDWKYWGDKPWSCMEWDEKMFPDPAGMMRELHRDLHVHLMTTIWPVVGEGCALFDELKAAGELFETPHWACGHIYDAYSQRGRSIYWKHVRRGLIDNGVDALWMDGTEPEFVSTHDAMDGARACHVQRDTAMGSWRHVLNGYSMMSARSVYEGQRTLNNGKRVFTLSRSGFAGQQRYAAASWSGDITANWKVLREQVAAGLNFAAAGMPWWTTDIGGFFTTGPDARFPDGNCDPAYRELHVRWFQWGAFCPLFRSHGTHTAREPWHFGPPGTKAYDALLSAARLRYRLLPYIYSEAWRVTTQGGTLMRPLAFDFRRDPATHRIADQFMFGPSLMVCPVLEPMFHATRHEAEVIPVGFLCGPDGVPGLEWYGFTGREFDAQVFKRHVDALDGNWARSPPSGLPTNDYSLRWEGVLKVPETGDYEFMLSGNDGRRLWLDGELLIDSWRTQGFQTLTVRRHFTAGMRLALRVDYFHEQGPASMSLVWRRPGMSPKSELVPAERDVYLPVGCDWYDFHSGERYHGGRMITVKTPIDRIPIFVRAGSFILLGPPIQYSGQPTDEARELHIYPGADARFIVYEDAGDGYEYEKGEYATMTLCWDDAKHELTIGGQQGSYPDMLRRRRMDIRLIGSNNGVIHALYVGEAMRVAF